MPLNYQKLLTTSSDPVDMSILSPETIQQFSKQDQSGQQMKLQMLDQLANLPKPTRMHSVEVNGQTFTVGEKHLSGLLQAGANYVGQTAAAGLAKARTEQIAPLARSKIASETAATDVAERQVAVAERRVDAYENQANALSSLYEKQVANYDADSMEDRRHKEAMTGNLRAEMINTMGRQAYYELEFREQQKLNQSIRELNAAKAAAADKMDPRTEIALRDLHIKENVYSLRLAATLSDDEATDDTKRAAITNYNSAVDNHTGYFMKDAAGSSLSPLNIFPDAAEPVRVQLPGHLPMSVVRAEAEKLGITTEEFLEIIHSEQ